MKQLQRIFGHLRNMLVIWKRIMLLFWHMSPTTVSVLLILIVLIGLLPSAQVQITLHLTQSVADAITGGKSNQLIMQAVFFGILQAGLVILSMLLNIIQQYLQNLLQLQLTNKISIQIIEKAMTLDLQHYENDELYDNLQRANRESSFRPYQIFTLMTTVSTQFVSLLSVVVVLLIWNWWFGLLILLAPLPSVYSQLSFGQKGYRIERDRAADRRRLAYLQFLMTNARSFKEIRLFRLDNLFVQRFRKFIQSFYAVDKKLSTRQSLIALPLSMLSILVSSGAQLYAVIITIRAGSIGLLAGYLQAIGVVQSSIQGLLFSLSQLYQNNLFVSNLFEFLDVPASQIKGGERPFPKQLQIGIEFRDVSFCYPGTSQTILDHLNLFFRAGECVALVGHNGAGKTTIVKLLSRLYEPSEGKILIDDVPIEEYDLDDLRRHTGVIFQDFVQYEMPARENIGFGNVDKMEEDELILRAARESGADAFIERLPQAYATPLGRMFEKGQELSIGQWQKVALARAFMRRSPIVILDEPTASIDAEAEAEIFNRLRQITQGATTLLIAHRFSTVRSADRIIVLERGKVIEDGTHSSLIRADGMYAHLFNLQAAGYLPSGRT